VTTTGRRFSAGQSIEDFCRACKTDRNHTIVVTDGDGQPLRVACGYCHSEHNYRGGPRVPIGGGGAPDAGAPRTASGGGPTAAGSGGTPRTAGGSAAPRPREGPPPGAGADPFPIVSEREVTMSAESDLELLLRRVIREETGITPVTPADRWRGGSLVLRPGTPGIQEKSWPIETFFHKVVMLRNRLRTLEQQVNAADLPDDAKVKLQAYITGCYGSLTSFNVLFAEEEDQFKGSGGE
jgi:hypothetical protein